MNMMTASEHMEKTGEFAIYPKAHSGDIEEAMYLALGLVNEAGEVAGKIKKLYRDGTYNADDIAKELGDVYWYAARLCSFIMYDVEEVLYLNHEKLSSRKERGVLGGSGDNR